MSDPKLDINIKPTEAIRIVRERDAALRRAAALESKLAEAEQRIAEQGKRLEALADKVMQHAVGDDTVYNDMVADAVAALAAYRKEGE